MDVETKQHAEAGAGADAGAGAAGVEDADVEAGVESAGVALWSAGGPPALHATLTTYRLRMSDAPSWRDHSARRKAHPPGLL